MGGEGEKGRREGREEWEGRERRVGGEGEKGRRGGREG